ncbi:MAG: JAB domain-containing protein, partial [Gammaproteobacteria bacterium]|nr:JAB domain-containing protein [Gammaproteobacteria bacterium]
MRFTSANATYHPSGVAEPSDADRTLTEKLGGA